MKQLQLGILFLALISGSVQAGPFEAGLSALDRAHYATAMRAWLELANEGAAEAQNNVGHLYEQGFGVSQNYATAMKWYRLAADQDLAEAQHNMGMLYYHGYGTAKNERVAIKWFKRAAQQGLADSEYMVGLAYHQGKGVPLDYELAKYWFLKSAKQSYANGQFMLAFMFQAGDGGDSEPAKALVWSELARRNGKADASDISDLSKLLVADEEIPKAITYADECVKTNYEKCPQ